MSVVILGRAARHVLRELDFGLAPTVKMDGPAQVAGGLGVRSCWITRAECGSLRNIRDLSSREDGIPFFQRFNVQTLKPPIPATIGASVPKSSGAQHSSAYNMTTLGIAEQFPGDATDFGDGTQGFFRDSYRSVKHGFANALSRNQGLSGLLDGTNGNPSEGFL